MSEIYIKVNNAGVITSIHHNPFDPTEGLNLPRNELEKEGFFVESIPTAEVIPGRRAIPKFNSDTKEVYYEYMAVPLSSTERLDMIEGLINEMMMGGLL